MVRLLAALLVGVSAEGPCDIFDAAKTPCVAAHSVTRALYATYDGPLYSVVRDGDANATVNISTVRAGGPADAAAQDAFCAGAARCKIATIFDQSPKANHLYTAPARHGYKDLQVDAARAPLTLGGAKVYAAYFAPWRSYHENVTKEVGVGSVSPASFRPTDRSTRRLPGAGIGTTRPETSPRATSRRRSTWSRAGPTTTARAASTTGTRNEASATAAPARWRR